MKITLGTTRAICCLAVLFLLFGCVAQELREEDRNKITVLKINPYIRKVSNFYYFGPGSSKELLDYAEKNGILIEKIVLQEISIAIRQSGKVKLSDSADTNIPLLNVYLIQYGFSIPHGFNWDFVPLLSIVCEIIDARGKILWRDKNGVSPLRNPVDPIPREKLLSSPKVIEDAWRTAAKQIAKNIVEGLERQLDQPHTQ